MRHVFLLVFAISLLAAASPARAGDGDGFSAWAYSRSGELDRQWEKAAEKWAPRAGAPDGTLTGEHGIRIRDRARARSRGVSESSLPAPGIGTDWVRTNLQFTKYNDGMLLLNSSRKRPHPGRGVSRLSSPAAATRGNFAAGRTPFNRNVKFTRTVHTKGRNAGSRLSAPMHGRITRGSVARTPSSLHGASRMRRQPSRGRW